MKIALRYKGSAYVSIEAIDHCVGGCTADPSICKLNVCDPSSKPSLAKHMGPLVWRRIGRGPLESLETEVLVLADGRIFRAVPHDRCEKCDGHRSSPLCTKYCRGQGDKALCEILGKFFQISQVRFEEVK